MLISGEYTEIMPLSETILRPCIENRKMIELLITAA
jgi:hypothetical protein